MPPTWDSALLKILYSRGFSNNSFLNSRKGIWNAANKPLPAIPRGEPSFKIVFIIIIIILQAYHTDKRLTKNPIDLRANPEIKASHEKMNQPSYKERRITDLVSTTITMCSFFYMPACIFYMGGSTKTCRLRWHNPRRPLRHDLALTALPFLFKAPWSNKFQNM